MAHRAAKCPKAFDDNIESESDAIEKYHTRDGMEHEWNNKDVLLQRAWHLPRLNSSCLGLLVSDHSVSVTPPQATNGERWGTTGNSQQVTRSLASLVQVVRRNYLVIAPIRAFKAVYRK